MAATARSRVAAHKHMRQSREDRRQAEILDEFRYESRRTSFHLSSWTPAR